MGRKGRMSEEKAAQITDQGREQFSDSQLSSDSCTLQEKVNPSLGTHVLNGLCLSHSRAVCLSIKSDKRYLRVGLICITPFMIYPFVYLPSLSPFPFRSFFCSFFRSFIRSFFTRSLLSLPHTHLFFLSFFLHLVINNSTNKHHFSSVHLISTPSTLSLILYILY